MVGGVVGEWAKLGEQSLVACSFFPARETLCAGWESGKAGARAWKGHCRLLGAPGRQLTLPLLSPRGKRCQQNSSHPAAGAMFIQYSKPPQKRLVAASETQTQGRPKSMREGGPRERLRKRQESEAQRWRVRDIS